MAARKGPRRFGHARTGYPSSLLAPWGLAPRRGSRFFFSGPTPVSLSRGGGVLSVRASGKPPGNGVHMG